MADDVSCTIFFPNEIDDSLRLFLRPAGRVGYPYMWDVARIIIHVEKKSQ